VAVVVVVVVAVEVDGDCVFSLLFNSLSFTFHYNFSQRQIKK